MSEVTRILHLIKAGDKQASKQLLPLVYDELRRLASARMAKEADGHSLQPTALVHEAYLRLVDADIPQEWNSKGHFFGAAAEAMRRILVESARKRQRLRHGGGRKRLDIDCLDLSDPNNCNFLTSLDVSLDLLAEEKPEIARTVNLRFFAGLSIEQTAEVTELSVRTINRHWTFAKAWLYKELSSEHGL